MLCLGCFDSNKSMKDLLNEQSLSQYLLEAMDISVYYGINPWRYLCLECEALLLKFVEFKRRVKRLFSIIYNHIQKGESIENETNIKLEWQQENDTPKIKKCIAELNSESEDFSNMFNVQLPNENSMELPINFGGNDDELSNNINLEHSNESSIHVYPDYGETYGVMLKDVNIKNSNKSRIKLHLSWDEHNEDLVKETNDKLLNKIVERTLEVEVMNVANKQKKTIKKSCKSKARRRKQTDVEKQLMSFTLNRKDKSERKKVEKTNSDTKNRKPFKIAIDPSKIKIIKMNLDEQRKLLEAWLHSEEFKNLPHGCNLCGTSYLDEMKLQDHMVSHDKISGDLECQVCHIRLSTKHNFSRHERNHELLYQCLACKYNTCYRSGINRHYNHMHENAKQYKCQHCPKVYTYRVAFEEHEKMHLSEPETKCETCGKMFYTMGALRKHQIFHKQVKTFACDQCDKKFVNVAQLEAHTASHSTEPKFYCALCDVKFKYKSMYDVHMRMSLKHVNPEDMKYKCCQCLRRFHEPSLLHKHELTHTGKRHPCKMCERTFVVRSSLNNHVRRIHDGVEKEKKYMCDKCGKAFKEKSILTSHIRTHTGERPFVCNLCDRAFVQVTALRTHHKLVHLKIKTAQSFQRKKKNNNT